MRNKANPRRGREGRGVPYKQSQFARTGPRGPGRRANARNEPNFLAGPGGPPSPLGPPASPLGQRQLYKQSQSRLRRAGRGPQGRGTRDKCAKQTQFPAEQKEGQVVCRKEVMVNGTCNRLRQNKANLPARPQTGAGRGSHRRSSRSGVLRQTNPICGSRAGKTITKAGGPDDAIHGGKRAKRTQFRNRELGQACGGTPALRSASSRLRRAKRAKQTQFPTVGIPHHSTTLLFHHSMRCRVCETKPICPRAM